MVYITYIPYVIYDVVNLIFFYYYLDKTKTKDRYPVTAKIDHTKYCNLKNFLTINFVDEHQYGECRLYKNRSAVLLELLALSQVSEIEVLAKYISSGS